MFWKDFPKKIHFFSSPNHSGESLKFSIFVFYKSCCTLEVLPDATSPNCCLAPKFGCRRQGWEFYAATIFGILRGNGLIKRLHLGALWLGKNWANFTAWFWSYFNWGISRVSYFLLFFLSFFTSEHLKINKSDNHFFGDTLFIFKSIISTSWQNNMRLEIKTLKMQNINNKTHTKNTKYKMKNTKWYHFLSKSPEKYGL